MTKEVKDFISMTTFIILTIITSFFIGFYAGIDYQKDEVTKTINHILLERKGIK